MIVFDIEDAFGIEIPYNANEEAGDFKTVGSVVDKVKALMAGAGDGQGLSPDTFGQCIERRRLPQRRRILL